MAWLGILMLDTRFPRPPGDVGHAGSFHFEVRYRSVAGASPQRVVRERSAGLLQPFVDAAHALVAEGAAALSTSCGFLALFQRELQAALPVPVWTSALLKLPELNRPGIVTADAAALGPDHLRAVGADPATPRVGLPEGGHLQRVLLENRPTLNQQQAEADTVAAARALCAQHPQIDSIVLECTNLPPYAQAVRQATGRPVHNIRSLLHERWQALNPP
ncbi:hypothetical protein BurJ1DRAFT_4036 [Burkholderiales bacterium JOSHI_001]|nr:hypothetical protein BurJ1DRAFT_4036 [Burkholderiales bacterium JOSHI_001]